MPKIWLCIILLLQVFCTFQASAATLPPPLQLISNINLFTNGSHSYIKCLPKSNATYPIHDSPLELSMTFGHRPILTWQAITFLEDVLVPISRKASSDPNVYLPHGYYYYHELRHLGSVIVVPSFYRNFTWSDLYLVLHGLAEYIVKAPHAYEMCVEINFHAGGLAGVIFFDWWTPDVPIVRKPPLADNSGNLRLPVTDS